MKDENEMPFLHLLVKSDYGRPSQITVGARAAGFLELLNMAFLVFGNTFRVR